VAASGLFGVSGERFLERIPTTGRWPRRLAVACFPGGRRMGAGEDRDAHFPKINRRLATAGNEALGRRGLPPPRPRFPLRSACLTGG
jgi:hypothetical protein